MPGYDLFVSEANAFPAFVVPTFFISREMNNSSVLLFSYSHFFKVEKRVVHCCNCDILILKSVYVTNIIYYFTQKCLVFSRSSCL